MPTNFFKHSVNFVCKNYRSPTESWKRHEEKQQKAQELREKLLHEKADRLSTLTKKVYKAMKV